MPYLLELRHQLKGGIQGHSNRNLPAPKRDLVSVMLLVLYFPRQYQRKIKSIVRIYTSNQDNCQVESQLALYR